MIFFRFCSIIAVALRYGLDEIIARSFLPPLAARLWLGLLVWRRLREPRGKRLRLAFEELGPLFVKFGQVLSTRRDFLPTDIADELALLQDEVPSEPFERIASVLREAYGQPFEDVFAAFDREPLGSASVAQVHRAVLPDNTEVAVKILRPNIDRIVASDLKLMRLAAAIIENILHDGEQLRPRAVVDEFARCLGEETNLIHEAANCTQLGRNFASYPMLRTPIVHWRLCTSKVMVMELLRGTPVDQIEDLRQAGLDLEKLARAGIEIFFTEVFRDSFFHADMHPGNLHVDSEGRFVLLDYGIMGSLSDFDKEYIGANFLAFFNRDYRKVAVMHVEAGWIPPDTSIPQFEAAIRSVCEPIFSQPLGEISFGQLLLHLFQVARRFNVIVQPQLLLLQKTLLNIEGMGRQLAPGLNLWETAKPFLEKWTRQQHSPRRLLKLIRNNGPTVAKLLTELPLAVRLATAELNRRSEGASTNRQRRKQRFKALIPLGWILIGGTLALLLFR